jgi:tocopherol O-methyltransferase
MITPNVGQTSTAVARHYDELDEFYRDIWGDNIHHGYWKSGRETRTEAAAALSELVAEKLRLNAGMRLADIGCGYGETARLFASRYAVHVDGVTISERQFQAASARPTDGVSITLCDWLANGFSDESFDGAYAIESSEHIADKQRFFSEAYRVLKPGGRLAVCAWLARSDAPEWQRRYLLEPICRQGRLPGMGCEEDYRDLAMKAGFETSAVEDISAHVHRTWSICIGRLAAKAVTARRYIAFLLAPGARNKIFVVTLPLILAAYRTGAMRYCVFVFEKPDSTSRPLRRTAR